MKRHANFRYGGGRPKEYFARTGEQCPGMTTMIGNALPAPGLVGASNRAGRQGMTTRQAWDPATHTGSAAHLMIEAEVRGIPYEHDENDRELKQANLVDAAAHSACFMRWLDAQEGMEIICIEVPMVSTEMRLGGTIDILARKGDEVLIVDAKSGKGPYEKWIFQMGGYGLLIAEDPDRGEIITGAMVIQTGEGVRDCPKHGRRTMKQQNCCIESRNITIVRDEAAVWSWTAEQLRPAAKWVRLQAAAHHIRARQVVPMLERQIEEASK